MAYFDNAATTYPKPETVYRFMDEFYRSGGGSAGRGNYKMALSSGKLIADTRQAIKDLLHCPAKQVVFTPTATIALNIIIQGMIETGIRNVYISPFEHNAVTRVLHHFEQMQKIKVRQIIVTDDLKYDLQKIRYQFDECKPDMVIVSHASNVIGLISPVEEIFSLVNKEVTAQGLKNNINNVILTGDGITNINKSDMAGKIILNIPVKIASTRVSTTIKSTYRTSYALVRYISSRTYTKKVSSAIDTNIEKGGFMGIIDKIKNFFYS